MNGTNLQTDDVPLSAELMSRAESINLYHEHVIYQSILGKSICVMW